MTIRMFRRPAWLGKTAMLAFLAFLFCAGASTASAKASAGPCDILKDSGTPCIAAHSTTRALYADYNGPLYQLWRTDGQRRDIGVVAPGGIADAAAQDAFCAERTCLIGEGRRIRFHRSGNDDELGRGKRLEQALPERPRLGVVGPVEEEEPAIRIGPVDRANDAGLRCPHGRGAVRAA